MIMMMNSNDLTNIFTWEVFLLLTICHRWKFLCWLIWHCSNLQQQARPVWNTEEIELDNLWIFSPARRFWWENWCKRGLLLVRPGREGNPGICLQSRTWDRKRMMMVTIMIWTPVHLPMDATDTISTPNCDKAGVVGNSASSPAVILKSEPLPTCKKSLQAVDFQFVKTF